jgi:hypothetical protein
LYLDWDPAMLSWPKPRSEILDARHGNETFNRTRDHDLQATLRAAQKTKCSAPPVIPARELAWLEKEFAGFNEINAYPAHIEIEPGSAEEAARAIPCFNVSRRFTRRPQPSKLKHFLERIGEWCKGNVGCI